MLFLLRPPQTWMPFARPMTRTEVQAYRDHLQGAYTSTKRVPAYDPGRLGPSGDDVAARLQDLADLHRSGALTDEEFAAAKSVVLGSQDTER